MHAADYILTRGKSSATSARKQMDPQEMRSARPPSLAGSPRSPRTTVSPVTRYPGGPTLPRCSLACTSAGHPRAIRSTTAGAGTSTPDPAGSGCAELADRMGDPVVPQGLYPCFRYFPSAEAAGIRHQTRLHRMACRGTVSGAHRAQPRSGHRVPGVLQPAAHAGLGEGAGPLRPSRGCSVPL